MQPFITNKEALGYTKDPTLHQETVLGYTNTVTLTETLKYYNIVVIQ